MANHEAMAEMKEHLKTLPLPDGVNKIVAGNGDPNSRVIFIGHSPSASDNHIGLPYSGPAGDLLDELMHEADINHSEIYLTNLVKVWTWKDEREQRINRTPTMKEIKAWLPYVEQELTIIKPVAIVALGGTTAQFFLGKDFKITSSGNRWLEIPDTSPYLKLATLPKPKPWVMGLAQPSYLIHLQENSPESYMPTRVSLIEALKKVKQILGGAEPQTDNSSNDEDIPF